MELITCKCRKCKALDPAGRAARIPSDFLAKLNAATGGKGGHHDLVANAHGADFISRKTRERIGLVAA